MMFKAIVAIIAVIAMYLFVGDLRISFHPFKATFKDWDLAFAYLIIGVGIIMIANNYKMKGYEEGKKEAGEVYRSYLMDTDNE